MTIIFTTPNEQMVYTVGNTLLGAEREAQFLCSVPSFDLLGLLC